MIALSVLFSKCVKRLLDSILIIFVKQHFQFWFLFLRMHFFSSICSILYILFDSLLDIQTEHEAPSFEDYFDNTNNNTNHCQ
jgi:hypothetical protein